MSNTQIDYLLQLASPRPDGPLSAGRPRDDAPGFDDHFRQASASSPPSTSAPADRPFTADRGDSKPRSSANDDRPAKSAERPSQLEDDAGLPVEASAAEDSNPLLDDEANSEQHESEATTDTVAVTAPVQQTAAPAVVDDATSDANAQQGQLGELLGENGTNAKVEKSADATTAIESVATQLNGGSVAAESDHSALDSQGDEPTATPVQRKTTEKNGAVSTTIDPTVVRLTGATGDLADDVQLSAGSAAAITPANGTRRAKSSKRDTDRSNQIQSGDAAADGKRTRATAAAQANGTAPATESGDVRTTAPAAGTEQFKKELRTEADASTDDKPVRQSRRAAGNGRTPVAPAVPFAAANAQLGPLGDAASPTAAGSDASSEKITLGPKDGSPFSFARIDRAGSFRADGTARTADGKPMPNVDPARFVSRVARAIHTALERGSPLQLRLSPPELGSLRLELSVNQGALTATIETDNSNARNVLLDNLPVLRDRLADQNVRIERFDVDVRRDGDGSGSQPNPGPYERGHQRHHENVSHRAAPTHGTRNASTPEPASPISRSITNTSINVIA